MPSPLGHALGASAAGWAVTAVQQWGDRRDVWRAGAAFAALGMLPDIDLLVGIHRGPLHGLGSALVVGLVAFAWTRRAVHGVAAATAYASHTLLDWLGSDTSTPIGLMALWPISTEYYESDVHLFGAISRRPWIPGFWSQNLRAVAWELVILLPVAVLMGRIQRLRSQSESRRRFKVPG